PAAATSSASRAASEDERAMCRLFADVLGSGPVGVDDGFFDLGGHSLLAVRLISRIRAALGVEASIRAVFEHPTPGGLARALRGAAPARARLTPRDRPDAVPLSAAQRRLWFLDRLDGSGAAYHLAAAVRLTGALDTAAMAAAVTDVVDRHESLRTVFAEDESGPYQVVLPQGQSRFEVVPTTSDDLDDDLAAAAARPFDLTGEPPFRVTAFALSEEDAVLLVQAHHIAADAWSFGPLAADLVSAYTARAEGGAPDWAPLPVQYADYTLWQEELLGDESDPDSVVARQARHWQAVLAGAPEELPLPTDRPRRADGPRSGERLDFSWPADLRDRVGEVARAHGVSTFMVLQGALAVTLSRLGAGTDIPLGTSIAGRTDDRLDALVGFFVNTLVLRTDVGGDPSFAGLLHRVRDGVLAAYANQDLPFERLVDVVRPRRSLSRHPLFQVMLTLDNTGHEAVLDVAGRLPGLTASRYPVRQRLAKFDLSFVLTEHTGGFDGRLDYDADLFDHATADRIVAALRRVLTAVLADPGRPVSAVDLLDDDDRAALDAWNDTGEAPETTVVDLFEEQVRRTPDAPAVLHRDTVLSYAELDARAERLAAALAHRGVGPERLVGIALPRDERLPVALLGVLKVGAAYVPLDPAHPAERIAYLVEDSGVDTILTGAGMPVPEGVTALPVDHPEPAATRPVRPSPANTAYVIHTSGSTGLPKGVAIEHRSLAAYLIRAARAYPGADGVALVHSPVTFDLTVTALYTPLVSGGAVRMADLDTEAPRPDLLKATPSHLPLLATLPDAAPRRALVLAGEQLPGPALAEWRARHPDVTVFNSYGPTECTVNAVEHRLDPGDPSPEGPVPIGKPVPWARAYVLDERLRPVPPGVPGELYLGGAGVARGYRDRPAATAERFVASPFGPPGSRLYRSGDIARWTYSGVLRFETRVGDQVKLRGFRIGLTEVEHAVLRHPSVTAATALVREDRLGQRHLVVYAVGPDRPDLRAHAARFLPDHMVPAAVVWLDALPLTVHGKLDRAALPAPEFGGRGDGPEPRTERERLLAGLFQDVLGVTAVGVEDGFFDLGGDSISSLRLVAKALAAGLRITPRQVFQHRTVAALAAAAVEAPGPRVNDDPVGEFPLTPIMRELAVRGGDADTYNQAVVLRTPAEADRVGLVAVLQAVLDGHDVLRARRGRTAGTWTMTVPPPGSVAAAALLVRVPGDADPAEEARRARERLSPDDGRMLSATWFDRGADPGLLLLVAHHLVVDGVSWRVLADDLADAWRHVAGGRPAEILPVPLSFRGWALDLSDRAPAHRPELPHWRETLTTPDRLGFLPPVDPARDTHGTAGSLVTTWTTHRPAAGHHRARPAERRDRRHPARRPGDGRRRVAGRGRRQRARHPGEPRARPRRCRPHRRLVHPHPPGPAPDPGRGRGLDGPRGERTAGQADQGGPAGGSRVRRRVRAFRRGPRRAAPAPARGELPRSRRRGRP
ncbi:amino acid adenylation domain-containing protein, partial [Saccharothrix sp. MB29]|nr:amino acid adenylation domain-containing protein [Saccharothrix sp. MB29]